MRMRLCYPSIVVGLFVLTACDSSRPPATLPATSVVAPQTAAEHYGIGKNAFMERRFDTALREADAALSLDPKLGVAHRLRGSVLREWKRPAEAQAEYDLAIQIDPRDSWSYYNIGLIRYDAGDWVGAEKAYSKAIEIEPSPAAHNNRGWVRLQQKRYDDARVDFNDAITLDRTHVNARINLARIDIEESRFTAAIEALAGVIADDPENDEAFEVRALAYEKTGETAKSAADRARVAELRKRRTRPPHIPD